MFSSHDLIHLVFANEGDTYYCDNLLRLDLRQYLWLKLHEKYAAVYFLAASGDTFSIRTCGDLKCRTYEPAGGFWKLIKPESRMCGLIKWIHKQLTAKRSESAAFVCPLEDFCKAAEYPDAADELKSLAGAKDRTGILVLTAPVSVEKSKRLLLNDPVFKSLQESAVLDVRTGALRDLYGALKWNKGESCVFLNTFSRDRVDSILLHIAMERKERLLPPKDMAAAAEYLVWYLAGLEQQRDHSLFKSQVPEPYMRFQDLYEQLLDDDVWERLMGRLRRKGLADARAESAEPAAEYRMTWDKSSWAGKCMMLRIPPRIRQLDTGAERADDVLLDIQRMLLSPKNRDELAPLAGKASGFLEKLEALEAASSDDLGTYKRTLEALRFCVAWMYVHEKEEQISTVVEFLEGYIAASGICHQARKNVELNERGVASGTFTGMAVQKARGELAVWEKALRKYQDLVGASIMDLSMPSISERVMEQMEALRQEVEGYRSAQEVPAGDGTRSAPFSEAGAEEDAELYTLDDIDYSHVPPT